MRPSTKPDEEIDEEEIKFPEEKLSFEQNKDNMLKRIGNAKDAGRILRLDARRRDQCMSPDDRLMERGIRRAFTGNSYIKRNDIDPEEDIVKRWRRMGYIPPGEAGTSRRRRAQRSPDRLTEPLRDDETSLVKKWQKRDKKEKDRENRPSTP